MYLAPYGYAIGVEIVEEEANYAFLTGIDLGTSNLANKTAEGNIISLDGDIQAVKINTDKSKPANGTSKSTPHSLINTWCTYTVDKKRRLHAERGRQRRRQLRRQEGRPEPQLRLWYRHG